jgi:hypothetical protein
MEEPAYTDRPSIEERARKRELIHSGGNDRYSSLVNALSRGKPIPPEGARASYPWHPVLWTLVRIVVLVVVGYMAVLFGWRWWRQQQTDTWVGPTAAVQSGQRLAGCDAANARNDDSEPTWIRWQGTVYVQTDSVFPVLNQSAEGRTQFTETGYSLSQLRIVLERNVPVGPTPPALLVVSPPGVGASVYRPDAGCT